ncbi:uncharacterized protein LOC112555275 isoform X2 [Pomacea canaliculata]|uniref:uncharacterized protein LOC112555275 isoform X2 n=1 Tax=Pomacea canaliculata TaxID=400727 RepID=UPI000D727289|nr:uncharacterized protein LOC112555275 isoform X2 [Pomacea canaliculata]
MADFFGDSSDDEFLAIVACTIIIISSSKRKAKRKKRASVTRRPFESHKFREKQLSRTSTRTEVQPNPHKIQTNSKEQVESPSSHVSETEQTSERVCIASEIERWKEAKTILNIDKDEQFAHLLIDSFYATRSAQSSQDVQSIRPKVPADTKALLPQNRDAKLHSTVTRTGEQIFKVKIKNEPVQSIQPVHEFYDGEEIVRVIKQEESDSESLPSYKSNDIGIGIKEEADGFNPLGDETDMKATSYFPKHLQETDPELARPTCNRITKLKEEYILPACDAGQI